MVTTRKYKPGADVGGVRVLNARKEYHGHYE